MLEFSFYDFWKKRSFIKDSNLSSHYKNDTSINNDIKLVKKYIKKKFLVLDLGCGPLRLSSRIFKMCNHIDCVDFQKKYIELTKNYKNIDGFVSKAEDFIINKKYDLVLVFGLFTYFKRRQISKVLKNLILMTHKKSIVLIKDQGGIKKDVYINKFSKEIGSRYVAYYHHYKKNKKHFSKYFSTKVLDNIYKKNFQKFKNTKTFFYLLKHYK